jgi:hypothetical protein
MDRERATYALGKPFFRQIVFHRTGISVEVRNLGEGVSITVISLVAPSHTEQLYDLPGLQPLAPAAAEPRWWGGEIWR